MTLPQPVVGRPSAAPSPLPRPAAPRRRADVNTIVADLHARHGEELLRFCRWMLKDRDEASDAVQDTWIRAMHALGDERVHVTALRPWLYAVARNVCLDRLRDRKRASLHELDDDAVGDAPGADEELEIRQQAGAALALISTLSERQRSALLMRELAGMSIPEIATALRLTPERAAWAVGDARRALEEARAGSSMACEDARARMAAGHRGRTVRAHVGECAACGAHDRRLRAKRVLAPALVPLWWLRKVVSPLAASPAAAATVAALSLAAGGGGGLDAPPRAKGPRVDVRHAAPALVRTTTGHVAPVPRRIAAPAKASVAVAPRVVAAPSPEPYVASATTPMPVRAARGKVDEVLAPVRETVVPRVGDAARTVVSAVAETTATAGDVVSGVGATATQLVDDLT